MVRQRLGQHFLVDRSVIDTIVSVSSIGKHDIVVEVGPGKGILTKSLVDTGAHVIAIEWDAELAQKLLLQFKSKPNARVLNADIRTFDLMQYLHRQSGGQFSYRIVANLPYYLTSYLLRQVFSYEALPASMTLLIQREVADRIVAPAGSSDRSILSVLCQAYSDPHIVRLVSSSAFVPPPQVESAIIQFHHISRQLFTKMNEKKFFRLVKAGFSSKRKIILNSVAAGLGREKSDIAQGLEKAHILPTFRAEQLSLEQWKQLYYTLEG